MNHKDSQNNKYGLLMATVEVLLACAIILAFGMRMRMGIDFSDESWYVAGAYSVSEGSIPFVNKWTQAPGYTIPLAIAFSLYKALHFGNIEGIVLFSRYMFMGVLLSLAFFWGDVLKIPYSKEYDSHMFFGLAVFTKTANAIFELNYNTIGALYLLAIVFLVFYQCKDSVKKELILCAFGGVIAGRAFIATPSVCLAIFFIGVTLFFVSVSKALSFIAGGAASAVMYLTYVVVSGRSIKDIIYGLYAILNDGSYFKIGSIVSFQEKLYSTRDYLLPLLLFALVWLILKVCLTYTKKEQYISIMTMVETIIFLMIGLIVAQDLVKWGWFEGLFLYPFFKQNNIGQVSAKVIPCAVVCYASSFFFISWTNNWGFVDRDFWLGIPTCLTFLGMYFVLNRNFLGRFALVAGVTVVVAIALKYEYNNVYRDGAFGELNSKVESGIWKGCYTVESRARDSVELENEIQRITQKCDTVQFMDWVSFGYLMTDAEICSPSTIDPMNYTYRRYSEDVNDPTIMYDYYSKEKTVPNIIVYIDYGRDEQWSIEDSTWKYNEFVNSYYKKADYYFENDTFKMIYYELQDSQGAINYSEEHRGEWCRLFE